MKNLLLALLLSTYVLNLSAQETTTKLALPDEMGDMNKLEDTLALLSFIMMNDSIETNRFAACHKFIPTLVQSLKNDNSFQHPFERLPSISIQYPADSTFRIFTWQLYVDKGLYHYYGAIQMNTPELKLYPLRDRSEEVGDNLEQAMLTNNEWYGMIYYNVKEFQTKYGPHYLLFGFDRNDFMTKRKIIDVLHFRDGQAHFGAPVFISNDRNNPFMKSRIVLDYSAESSVGCNYDEFQEMIIFDHLEEMQTSVPGQGAANVPDGTFEGFKYEKGIWSYVPKVFHTVVDEPPGDGKPLEEQPKNIFGTQKQ